MIGGLLAIAAALASPAAVTAVSPPPVVCSDIAFVAARGSGESQTDMDRGMGAPLGATFLRLSALAAANGQTIQGSGVDYPAAPIDGGMAGYLTSAALVLHLDGPFAQSVDVGARAAAAQVTAIANQCPDTRIVLAGYSQGASVVVGALELLPAAVKTSIGSVLVFGDPGFDPTDTVDKLGGYDSSHYGLLGPHVSWSSLVAAPVISYCHDGDHVCGMSAKASFAVGHATFDFLYRDVSHILSFDAAHHVSLYEPHSTYEIEASDAAARLARVLTSTAPRATIDQEPVSTRAGPAHRDTAPHGPSADPGVLLLALGIRVRRLPRPIEPPRWGQARPERRYGRAIPATRRPASHPRHRRRTPARRLLVGPERSSPGG